MRLIGAMLCVSFVWGACQQKSPNAVRRKSATTTGDSAPETKQDPSDSNQTPTPKFTSLDDLFASTSDVRATKTTSEHTSGAVYEISFKQPLDHKNESAGFFEQKIVLIHRGADRPVVLHTEGYEHYTKDNELELTKMYEANQISVEYRYFGESKPATDTNNTYLNIWQAATDHHAIVQFFKQHYTGRWVNTGVSKGGMSTVFHRRFYPQDVDASVPYVAPISFAAPDTRYTSFLNSLGSETCKANLRAFQVRSIQLRDQLALTFKNYVNQRYPNTIPDTPTAASYIEHFVADFAWGFWQYFGASDCANFPTASSNATTVFNFLNQYLVFDYMFDPVTEVSNDAYAFQAERELGYPDQRGDISAIQSMLSYYDASIVEQTSFYDPAPMKDIANWVKQNADKMVFIYGGTDPWTAGAFDFGANFNISRYVVSGGNHGSEISMLSASDKAAAVAKLDAWLGAKAKSVTTLGLVADQKMRRDFTHLKKLDLQRIRKKIESN